jgi:hypothetical protein
MNTVYETDYNGYYVLLIIVYIVTIAIGIALSFYFIFLPATRIENEFEVLQVRGSSAITDINNLINTTEQLSEDVRAQTCTAYIFAINQLFGLPHQDSPTGGAPTGGVGGVGCIADLYCVNNNPLIPSICNPYITNVPHCCIIDPSGHSCPPVAPPIASVSRVKLKF